MTGPHPAVAAVRSAVRAACADLPAGALVLVACSGGPDSSALAAATAWLASTARGPRRTPWRAGAVVVDHDLAPGSAQVAGRTARWCADLGLAPADVVLVDAARDATGPEAAARAARHAALAEAAARHGASAVLLGHTLDDQAEQVLLGLARGSGARSLAGMPARRGVLRRPLLELPRATTVAACQALGLHPWLDPANADPAFTRSRTRTRVLPVLEAELGPGVAAALARTAAQLREDAEVLEGLADDLLADARRGQVPDAVPASDRVVLDAATLDAAPAALRRRALRAALVAVGAPADAVHRRHVQALEELVTAWHGQGPLDLPGRVGARRACGRVELARRPAATALPEPLHATGRTPCTGRTDCTDCTD